MQSLFFKELCRLQNYTNETAISYQQHWWTDDGLDGQSMDFQLNVPYINNQGIYFSVLLLICESFLWE